MNLKKNTPPLSKEEYNEVKNTWKISLGNSCLPISPKGYMIYKKLEGFDACYCDETFFPNYILRSLNLPVHVLGFEHKAMYDQIFPELTKPKTIFKCINGVYFDMEMNVSTIENCFELSKQYASVCVKITTFSACGLGVTKLDVKKLQFCEFVGALKEFGDNFIVQEILSQSPKMATLSNTSLNTFRVSSLFINGKCSICTIMNRIGRGNSFIDNGLAGNFCIGVETDGSYRKYAYDKYYNIYTETETGIKFDGFKLDEIKDLVELVLKSHPKYLPHCGFCGWDFALDANGHWNLIEVNLYAPGIELEQISAGKSIFGNRTSEVVKWVNDHQPSLLAILTSLGAK